EAAVDQDFVVNVGAGRLSGRADKANHLALADVLADLEALGEGGHVSVGGLVAVVMFQLDVFAVAAFPAGYFDGAVAGGENRGAIGGGPVDAGVHLDVAEDRMSAAAAAGSHDRIIDRP